MAEVQLIPFEEIPAAGSPIGLVALPDLKPVADAQLDVLLEDAFLTPSYQPLNDNLTVGGFTFGIARIGGVHTGKVRGYWTADYSGTIDRLFLTTDTGGFTVKFWKIGPGPDSPTAANSINLSGFVLAAPITHMEITQMYDFTTVRVGRGDTMAVEIVALTGVPTDIGGQLIIMKD